MDTKDLMSKMRKSGMIVLFLALSLLLLTASAFAQVTASGALSGTVLDKNGAVIKGATVTATNKATGQARTATTNDSGEHKIDLLPAGRYDVKVNASVFANSTSENVELLVCHTH